MTMKMRGCTFSGGISLSVDDSARGCFRAASNTFKKAVYLRLQPVFAEESEGLQGERSAAVKDESAVVKKTVIEGK